MTITLQINNSETKKITKSITDVTTLTGTLKNETSIIDPVITNIEDDGTNVLQCNYMTIPDFNRSYFITNIRSIRKDLWEITAHVDVLSSFKEEILNNNAIVSKQENNWNLYIDDGTFKVYQNPIVYTKEFPAGFTDWSFIMTVAGSAQAV
jgi:hypothetical protein